VAYQKLGQPARAAEAFEALVAHCRSLQRARETDGKAADWQLANFMARAGARQGLTLPDPPRLEGDDRTYFVQSARLHAVQGRKSEALSELTRGLSLVGLGEIPHLQDDPDFESLRDEPEFKRLVTERLPRP
jgi:hypothetical protein